MAALPLDLAWTPDADAPDDWRAGAGQLLRAAVAVERQRTLGRDPKLESLHEQEPPERLPHAGRKHHHVEK